MTLRMEDLRRIARDVGLDDPRTYIASGNLLFEGDMPDDEVKERLQAALSNQTGKTVWLTLRTAEELAAVSKANPFASKAGNRVYATFLDSDPPESALTDHKHLCVEEIALGPRVLYVHYPDGMGRSRLTIPAAAHGTARNMNTVAKLAELAEIKADEASGKHLGGSS